MMNGNNNLRPSNAVLDACPTRNTDTTNNPTPLHPALSNFNSEGTANDTDLPPLKSITDLLLLSSTDPGGMAISSTNTHHRRFQRRILSFKIEFVG